MAENVMEKIVALAKRRGFIYPGSDIYGGLANTYDYGPMGAELLRSIRNVWWESFINQRPDMVGLDSSLISHQRVWEASGHVGGFADALIDCKNCKLRMRADHLLEDFLENVPKEKQVFHSQLGVTGEDVEKAKETKKVEGLTEKKMDALIQGFSIPCPKCKKSDWTAVRKFNLLFPVHLGIVEGDKDLAYLRGETAQGIFINFKNIVDSTRVKLPFGVGQIGKSFRNEITPGNSVFRTLEFEQGEIEYFFDPETTVWEPLFEEWKKTMWKFATETLGIKEENLRWRTHADEERSFYSKRTEDLEYKFPFGFKELWGLAYRTDYDLAQHEKFSTKELAIVDPQSGKKIRPHVIEPAVGINRLFLMILADAYAEEGERVVLKIKPSLAPTTIAVFPLLANKEQLTSKADAVYAMLNKQFRTVLDARGNIGKRYFAQDEVGTPFCVTVDFQTLEDDTVTVRERDSMEQKRVAVNDLPTYISSQIG